MPLVYPEPACVEKSPLKESIKSFLAAASSATPGPLNCLHCGRPMKYIDTVFWLYGEERSFPIRLQRCACTAEPSQLPKACSAAIRKID